MKGRIETMKEAAARAVEGSGDQVQGVEPDVIYFPFECATVTGIIVTGLEDQYMVLCGAEGEPFAVIRQDGRLMPRGSFDPQRRVCIQDGAKPGQLTAYCPSLLILASDVSFAGLGAIVHYRLSVPIPGNSRTMIYCRQNEHTCCCCRDGDGNRVDTDLVSAALGLAEVGHLIGGGVWGNKV